MIAAFPNWDADHHGAAFANADGVYLRNAWEEFGTWAPNAAVTAADGATTTAKDMADEQGNRPFAILAERDGLADFDHLNPAYFRSLDRKMRHLSEQGFVPFLETVRRDNCPAWKAYFDFDRPYARFVQYLAARYGAFNLILSGIHLDWIPKEYSLTADEFNAALTHHRKTYGPLPFDQPFTTLIDSSTYKRFGHGERAPWLTMHTVEDPYLTGKMGVAFVTGLQGDGPKYLTATATAKHYAVHSGPEPLRHGFDAKASSHDVEDTYLPAFREAVVAGKVRSVMCVYNAVNGVPGCASGFLLDETLRRDWKVEGFVTGDCNAVDDIRTGHKYVKTAAEAAAAAIKAGTDNDCVVAFGPQRGAPAYQKYVDAVRQGLLTEDRSTPP